MKKNNIVLIGMSGCGKTTIGQLLAERLGMIFLDTDKMVEDMEGMSISRLFSVKGEGYFRLKETQVCRTASIYKDAVIATGGGVVLSRENMSLLKESGVIVYIERDIEEILRADAQSRPLFTSPERVRRIYNERKRLYDGYADILLKNDAPPAITADKLIFMLEQSRESLNVSAFRPGFMPVHSHFNGFYLRAGLLIILNRSRKNQDPSRYW